ncbi:hypothetical protein FAZ19_10075 [Sphingobacterium alkalisoli]|uniref:Uncharacterized protein n=1 Tax=Sphingobacterium alkalisoli TaxID=1874115 RepID=A0A4V5LY72_9SPHI|nr:hypothetical protein [Sphingobacterium alkalisoli]TJY65479.1 hypothetical protein FAZ19_10075 [Sphingobacterium alkalisoli]GGH20207.1 hypothetical protein GCM10011418_25220 [Sphingobacterium alkalisoli]
MKKIYFLLFSVLFFGCEKKEPASEESDQIEFITYEYIDRGIEGTVSDIHYDQQGRLVQLSSEHYTYDSKGRLQTIKIFVSPTDFLLYTCLYDEHDRIKEIVWNNEEQYASSYSSISVDSRFTYEGSSSLPKEVQKSNFDGRRYIDNILSFLNIESNLSTFTTAGGNATGEINTIDGWLIDPLTAVQESKSFKYTWYYTHDNKPNVFRKLFAGLNWMPQSFASKGFRATDIFNTNNVIEATLQSEGSTIEDGSATYEYKFDAKGRVSEIRAGLVRWTIHYRT